MTKLEQMGMLSNQEIYVIAEKAKIQKSINECFDEYECLLDPSRYDELKRNYEFYNGQQCMLRIMVSTLKLNVNKYYEMLEEKEMRLQRQAL